MKSINNIEELERLSVLAMDIVTSAPQIVTSQFVEAHKIRAKTFMIQK